MLELSVFEKMVKELRITISSIAGVKSIDETLSIEYLAEVATDEEKDGVHKVGAVLSSQAEKFGFTLQLIPATSAEIKEAKDKMSEYISSQIQFKA